MTSFDVRRLAFTKANRKYVNQFEQVVSKTTTPTIESNETHKFTCPVCLGPMVEHIIPGGENRLACQQCKFSGGMDQ